MDGLRRHLRWLCQDPFLRARLRRAVPVVAVSVLSLGTTALLAAGYFLHRYPAALVIAVSVLNIGATLSFTAAYSIERLRLGSSRTRIDSARLANLRKFQEELRTELQPGLLNPDYKLHKTS